MAQPFVSQRAINGKINFLWIFPYYIWITAFEISYSYFVYVKTDTRHGHETSLPFHGAQSVKSKFVSYIIIYKILPLIHKKQLFIKYPIILGMCVYVAVPDIGYSRSLQPIVYLRIYDESPHLAIYTSKCTYCRLGTNLCWRHHLPEHSLLN